MPNDFNVGNAVKQLIWTGVSVGRERWGGGRGDGGHGDAGTGRRGDAGTRRWGDAGTGGGWRGGRGGGETGVGGDAGTRGRGDGETRGRGEVTWPDGEHLLVLPDCGGGCGGGYGLRRRLVARLSGPPAAVSRPLPADPQDAL